MGRHGGLLQNLMQRVKAFGATGPRRHQPAAFVVLIPGIDQHGGRLLAWRLSGDPIKRARQVIGEFFLRWRGEEVAGCSMRGRRSHPVITVGTTGRWLLLS